MSLQAPLHPSHISSGYRTFIGVTVFLTTLSTACVACRFSARQITGKIGRDDWAAFVALVFAYGFLCTTIIVATVGGAGYPIDEYTPIQLVPYFKIVLANNVIYNASVTSSKISALLFYRRIFISKGFKKATLFLGLISIANLIQATFGLIFAYTPVEAQWDFWLPHTNINNDAFWLAGGIINCLIDVAILALPQTQVWRLNQPLRRRILISSIFLLGGFVVITSILRIIYLETVNFTDFTETLTIAGIWTMTELNTSIICVCLPTFPALFRSWYDGTLPNGKHREGASLRSAYLWLRRRTTRGSRGSSIQSTEEDDSIALSNKRSFRGHVSTETHHNVKRPEDSSSMGSGIGIRHEINITTSEA